MIGQRGVLTSSEDMVQCHICGRWFKALGIHVTHKHGISADDYREEFGLNKGQGLIADVSAKRYAEASRKNAAFVAHTGKPDGPPPHARRGGHGRRAEQALRNRLGWAEANRNDYWREAVEAQRGRIEALMSLIETHGSDDLRRLAHRVR